MTTLETILAAIVLALISGIIGRFIGAMGTVQKPFCDQLRSSCQALLIEKIETLGKQVEALTKVVDSKLLGI
jgi:UDP-glucose 6-dehydrogenase